jgi:hypothetical protein
MSDCGLRGGAIATHAGPANWQSARREGMRDGIFERKRPVKPPVVGPVVWTRRPAACVTTVAPLSALATGLAASAGLTHRPG